MRRKVSIVDELRSIWMRGYGRNLCEKRVAFDVAMLAKACGDAVEVAVVVARMADEFEDALGGNGVENLVEGFAVEVAGVAEMPMVPSVVRTVGRLWICGWLFEGGLAGTAEELLTCKAAASACQWA